MVIIASYSDGGNGVLVNDRDRLGEVIPFTILPSLLSKVHFVLRQSAGCIQILIIRSYSDDNRAVVVNDWSAMLSRILTALPLLP